MAELQTFSRDALVAGETFGAVPVPVAASQTIVRGQVLSFASGKVSAAGAKATPYGIAADSVTTGETGDTSVPVYTVGIFNENALVFADGITADEKAAQLLALRNIGLVTTHIVEA